MNDGKTPKLSGLELEVMNVVWELGDCTSADVIEAFQRRRKLAPTTIRTVLTKLREKGYVRQIPSLHRGYAFRPAIAREKVARRSLRDLLRSVFEGSPAQAICYLLEEDISEEELAQIRQMLERHPGRKQKGRTK